MKNNLNYQIGQLKEELTWPLEILLIFFNNQINSLVSDILWDKPKEYIKARLEEISLPWWFKIMWMNCIRCMSSNYFI